jgi:transposase-like protein
MGKENGPHWKKSNGTDTGCEFCPRCLECTFEECLDSIPRGMQQMRLKLRASAIKKMRHSGIGVKEVAKAFGVSIRTVQREMKRIRRIKK